MVSADVILDHVEYYFDSNDEKMKSIILANIREEIIKQAQKDKCYPEDYASTLNFLCFNKITGQILCFSLGNSRIYRIRNNSAEYVNQTLAHEHNRVCSTVSYSAESEAVVCKDAVGADDEFLLCTDGMWKIAEAECLFESFNGICDGIDVAKYLEQCKINDDCSFLLAA